MIAAELSMGLGWTLIIVTALLVTRDVAHRVAARHQVRDAPNTAPYDWRTAAGCAWVRQGVHVHRRRWTS